MRDNAYFSSESDPAEYVYDSIISFSYKENQQFFSELISGTIEAKKIISYPDNPNILIN